MRFIKYFCFFILPAVLLSGCASRKSSVDSTPKATQKNARVLSEEETINLKYLFVNANKEKILGNDDKAAELFAQCIRIDGSNHAAMYELAQIYASQKKINDAIFFARSASQIAPSNIWYRLFLAEFCATEGADSPNERQFPHAHTLA